MQSIVRHDYYPDRPAAPSRPVSPTSRLRSVEALSTHQAASTDSRAISAPAITAAEPRRFDVFRLVVALAGLAVYLGLPVAGLVYLVRALFA